MTASSLQITVMVHAATFKAMKQVSWHEHSSYLSSKLYQVPVVWVVVPLSAETGPKNLDIATKQTIHIPFSY